MSRISCSPERDDSEVKVSPRDRLAKVQRIKKRTDMLREQTETLQTIATRQTIEGIYINNGTSSYLISSIVSAENSSEGPNDLSTVTSEQHHYTILPYYHIILLPLYTKLQNYYCIPQGVASCFAIDFF